MNDTQQKGLTRSEFARYYVMKLGIGSELQRMAMDPRHPPWLDCDAEIMELMSELKPAGEYFELLLKRKTTSPQHRWRSSWR